MIMVLLAALSAGAKTNFSCKLRNLDLKYLSDLELGFSKR